MIDKQWVAAIKKLEELGYTFAEGEWMEPGHGGRCCTEDHGYSPHPPRQARRRARRLHGRLR